MFATSRVPNVSNSILDNVLEMIGNTPMVRLDKIAKSEGLECELRESIITIKQSVHLCAYFRVGIAIM